MRIDELDYEHPEEQVAQRPAPSREDSRLLVLPAAGGLSHRHVRDLPSFFRPGDLLVLNDSRVEPARLKGHKSSGARVEVLIIGCRLVEGRELWSALLKSSRSPRSGVRIELAAGLALTVVGREGQLFLLEAEGDLRAHVLAEGLVPLPPYIRREADADDVERYQTSFARDEGDWGTAAVSSAAPTAGLHLTPALLDGLAAAEVAVLRVTLGVGPGTFRPVQVEDVSHHPMHEESIEISEDSALQLRQARREGRRITAVGTTVVRALEAAATPAGEVRALSGSTGLFLMPGSPFRVVHRLLTNFHQPRSTLLALVSAFVGQERLRAAYQDAVSSGYRLFSYGDAMLLEPCS